MRPTTIALLTALTLILGCRNDADSAVECLDAGFCWEQADACCCPPAGTGIDCMPVMSECALWMLDSCDVYCASY